MYEDYSVLMSVYYKERPDWLRESIESILNQSIMTNDFVIVEDGPLNEALYKVLNYYEIKHPQIINRIRLEKNVGLGPALGEGIFHCKNDLVARMDSDDYSIPERCEKLLSVFKNNTNLSIVGSFEVEFENDISDIKAIHRVPENSYEIFEFMKKRCALLHPTVMFKKSAVLEAGNYRNMLLYEDYDLFMRMIIEKKQIAYNIQENLYYIRINDAFFSRRGGVSYMKTAVLFKFNHMKQGHMSILDFIISAGSQSIVCLMPNFMRKWIYLKLLRK